MKHPLMRNNILREDLDAVIEHLKQEDPILTNGPKVREFEEQWSKWLGVKYSIFVNSGSSANLLTMASLKIKFPEGGEVIVPPLTWVSDISSVIQNGFTPVFVDIDPETLAMDGEKIIEKLTNKTRAVFLTHIQGFNGLTTKLINKLKEKKIHLIEDVCESHGATHNNRKTGTFGWISNFSFFYAHHMSTIEGGMICTNDDKVYQNLRMLRSHGMVRESNNEFVKDFYQSNNSDLNSDFIFAFPAYNVRNTEIGAIMGISQLRRLDLNIKKRAKNLKYFLNNIDKNKYQTEFKLKGSSNYAFNLILKSPDDIFVAKLMNKMQEAGIEFRRGSSGGGNQLRQPYLKGLFPDKYYKEFPVVEHVHFYGFYIGNFPDLRIDEIDYLCSVVNSVE
jgi:CDP-4-dehydro-6-deoxyglucose reductase, E1